MKVYGVFVENTRGSRAMQGWFSGLTHGHKEAEWKRTMKIDVKLLQPLQILLR